MAVLKDLIVHGASRFLNGIRTTDIIAENMWADVGIFNQLIATTLKAETANIDQLTAQNATVYGVMDVKGKLQTNNWEAANISSVGGNFYISPTGKSSTGTVTITRTAEATQSSDATYNIQMSGTFGVSSTSTTIWSAGALGMATGNITVGNKKYPLGTCDGTLSNISTGTNSITGFTINNKTSAVLDIIFAENASLVSSNQIVGTGSDLQVSVYQGKSGDNYYPVGILLTSYGKSGDAHQYIDIYSGTDATSSWSASTGFAQPSVRIGDLNGLPSYPNSGNHTVTPQGWGLYTTNGYFKGDVFANTGYIGTFTIDSSSMHAPQNRAAWNTNADGIWIAATVIAGGKQMGSAGTGYTATDPIWYIKADGSAKFGAMTVDSAGLLSVPAANITGKLTALQIDVPGVITAGSITTGTITMGTAGSSDYIYVSKDSKTLTINGESKAWKIVSGSTFGVTSAGYMTASSGKIAGWTITDNRIEKDNTGSSGYRMGIQNAAASNSAAVFYAGTNTAAGGTIASSSASNFYVTQAGYLFSQSGSIGRWTINDSWLYRSSSVTTGTASTQYQAGIQSPSSFNSDYSNAAFIVRHRSYNGGDQGASASWGSWTNDFYVSYNGKLYANNADIKGKIEATSGYIAGWSITGSRIEKDNTGAGGSRCGIQNQTGSNDHTVFYAGCSTAAGGSIWDESKTNFFVTNGGYLFCNNAKIKGTITATAGKIGGWTINSDDLSYGTWGTSGGATIKPAGTVSSKSIGGSGSINGWVLTLGANFGVTKTGAMYATSGKIGGFTIGDYLLEARDKLKNETQYWRCGIQTPIPTLESGAACFYAGCTTATGGTVASLSVTNFYVTHAGKLYCNEGNVHHLDLVSAPAGGTWVKSRDNSSIRREYNPANSGSYYPMISMDTYNSHEWSMGTVGDNFYISHTLYSDYTANNNVHTFVSINTAGLLYADGGLSTGGYLSVTGTITGSSTITAGSNIRLNNNVSLQGKNTSGTYRSLIWISGTNTVNVGNADGGVYVNGTSFSGSKSYTGSDLRLKHDIIPLDKRSYELLLKLKPFEYKWNKNQDNFHADGICFGLGAQDLIEVLNDVGYTAEDYNIVGTTPNGYYAISYIDFIPHLIYAVQKQHKEIEQLKKEIQELKNK